MARCRQLAPGLSDDQLRRLIGELYELAACVVDVREEWQQVSRAARHLSPEEQSDFEERRSILEFDAGLPSEIAAARALRLVKGGGGAGIGG